METSFVIFDLVCSWLPVTVYQLDIAIYASTEKSGSDSNILNNLQENLEM